MSVDRTSKLIAIIDDDEAMQDSLRDLMEAAGLVVRGFGSAEFALVCQPGLGNTRATNREAMTRSVLFT
jgi:FixJ family two-component response regulator